MGTGSAIAPSPYGGSRQRRQRTRLVPSQCDRWPLQPRVPVHVTSILHPIFNLNERLYRSGTELVQAGGSHDCLPMWHPSYKYRESRLPLATSEVLPLRSGVVQWERRNRLPPPSSHPQVVNGTLFLKVLFLGAMEPLVLESTVDVLRAALGLAKLEFTRTTDQGQPIMRFAQACF